MDRKARAMLILGLLNDAYGDVRNILYYLQDFTISHASMAKDMEEFGILEIIESARELESKIVKAMDKLKLVVYR